MVLSRSLMWFKIWEYKIRVLASLSSEKTVCEGLVAWRSSVHSRFIRERLSTWGSSASGPVSRDGIRHQQWAWTCRHEREGWHEGENESNLGAGSMLQWVVGFCFLVFFCMFDSFQVELRVLLGRKCLQHFSVKWRPCSATWNASKPVQLLLE